MSDDTMVCTTCKVISKDMNISDDNTLFDHVKSRPLTSRHIMLDHVESCQLTTRHVTPRQLTTHHVKSRLITPHHITSYHITSHHITSQHITSQHITSHHSPRSPPNKAFLVRSTLPLLILLLLNITNVTCDRNVPRTNHTGTPHCPKI